MKKFMLIVLMITTNLIAGCVIAKNNENKVAETSTIKIEEPARVKQSPKTTEKKIYAGSEQRSCLCLKEKEYVDDFLKAAHDDDIEYLGKMAWTGKAFYITYDTRVLCSEGEVYKGMVYITVLEGKFEGYSGYTFSKRLRPIKKSPTSRNAGGNFYLKCTLH